MKHFSVDSLHHIEELNLTHSPVLASGRNKYLRYLLLARAQRGFKSMISKANTTKSFGRTIGYLMNRSERFEVMICYGVSEDKKIMIKNFELQSSLNKRCKIPGLHLLLSHHPNDTEKIVGQEMEIINAWIAELRIQKDIDLYSTQFVCIKHRDRDHIHYHFAVNLVTDSGKRLNVDYIGLKMKDISKQLTKRFGLTPAVKKEYQQAVIEQNYQIKKGIDQVLSDFGRVNRKAQEDNDILHEQMTNKKESKGLSI